VKKNYQNRAASATVPVLPEAVSVVMADHSTSKSAVSRRFVAATETALRELLAGPLGELDLVALMIDGVHFGDHLCVVALGIGNDGTKHPLGLVEGSTENTTVVTDLLTGLRDRGLDTSRAIFVGIDGGKALRAAVVRVFDHPVIQRCQLHKIRINRPSCSASRGRVGAGVDIDAAQVAFDAGHDAPVAGGLGIPAAGQRVVAEGLDVVELGLQGGGKRWGRLVVVALFADVGVRAGAGNLGA
jgi:hypothetical protein